VISGCHAGVYRYMPEVRHILGTLQGGATLHAPVIYWLARGKEQKQGTQRYSKKESRRKNGR
jgi:hypothetical protein